MGRSRICLGLQTHLTEGELPQPQPWGVRGNVLDSFQPWALQAPCLPGEVRMLRRRCRAEGVTHHFIEPVTRLAINTNRLMCCFH